MGVIMRDCAVQNVYHGCDNDGLCIMGVIMRDCAVQTVYHGCDNDGLCNTDCVSWV